MNIFDLRGPEFLAFFVQAELVGVIAAFVSRSALINAGSKASEPATTFDQYDAAYLKGGEEHVFLTAIATLSTKRKVEVSVEGHSITGKAQLDADAHAVERVIENTVWHKSTAMKTVYECVEPTLKNMRTKLACAGLVPSAVQEDSARLVSAACVAVPIVFLAFPKLAIGMAAGRPVGFLVGLAVVAGLIAAIFLMKRTYATSRGEKQLLEWQQSSNALRSNLSTNPTGMKAADIAMAYALYGALKVGIWDEYANAKDALRQQSAGSCGSGGSSCGGGGCGGGCGGCGG